MVGGSASRARESSRLEGVPYSSPARSARTDAARSKCNLGRWSEVRRFRGRRWRDCGGTDDDGEMQFYVRHGPGRLIADR